MNSNYSLKNVESGQKFGIFVFFALFNSCNLDYMQHFKTNIGTGIPISDECFKNAIQKLFSPLYIYRNKTPNIQLYITNNIRQPEREKNQKKKESPSNYSTSLQSKKVGTEYKRKQANSKDHDHSSSCLSSSQTTTCHPHSKAAS